jgi:hypothetical protein
LGVLDHDEAALFPALCEVADDVPGVGDDLADGEAPRQLVHGGVDVVGGALALEDADADVELLVGPEHGAVARALARVDGDDDLGAVGDGGVARAGGPRAGGEDRALLGSGLVGDEAAEGEVVEAGALVCDQLLGDPGGGAGGALDQCRVVGVAVLGQAPVEEAKRSPRRG